MRKYKRTIIAAISDTHAGHKLGLCNPETELEEVDNNQNIKYHPQLSETQKFLWETYKWGVNETIKLAGDDDLFVIHNGDPTHGKAGFLVTMTSRMSDQILIAQANLNEWFKYKNMKGLELTIGTGLHEMGEGSSSLLIAELLRNKYPKIDVSIVYHGLLSIRGIDIDYAHHGAFPGSRVWLKGNEMRYYLRDIMMREVLSGKKPPDLVLRGHYHVYRREFVEITTDDYQYGSWIVTLPGFTFKDDYTRRATKSEFKQSCGMVVFEILDGQLYKTHKFVQSVDIRTRKTIE